MVSIPINDNGPVDPPASSLTGEASVMAAYREAYEDYEASENTPDEVPQPVTKKKASEKPLKKTSDVTSTTPKRRRRQRAAVENQQPSDRTNDPNTATTEAPADAPADRPTNEKANIAAMVASPAESTKELGLKLEKARRNMAKSKDAERLRAIPEATADNPKPWVHAAGASAGLAPIPPKGEAPTLKKNGTKAAESTKNHTPIEVEERNADPNGSHNNVETVSPAPSTKVVNAGKTDRPARAVTSKARKKPAEKDPKTGLIGRLLTEADDGLSSDPAGPVTDTDKKTAKKKDAEKEPDPSDKTEKASDEEEDVNLDDPRYRDDGVPTGLVEDIAPKRLSQKEIKNLPGRLPTKDIPKLPGDDDEESPAVAALMTGDWLSEEQPIHSVYRYDANLDGPEGGPVLTPQEAMADSMAEEEADFLRHRTPANPPQPDWSAWSSDREDRRPEADYAMRMDAWEKAVIATHERKGCDIPEQHRPRDVRENLGTGTDTTVAGFPSPMPLREWRTEDGRPVLVDAVKGSDGLAGHGPTSGKGTRLTASSLASRWRHTDRSLRLALTSLTVAVIGAVSGWLSARIVLPSIVAESTPVAIAAIVREEDVRELMVLANLLDQKAHTHRRAPIAISPFYLPDSLLDADGRPLPGLLTDLHFRAALKEAADRLGAPVMSASTVLAIPSAGEEKHPLATQTLDITEDVKALLGLSGLESAALRDLLNQWLKAEDRSSDQPPRQPAKNRR